MFTVFVIYFQLGMCVGCNAMVPLNVSNCLICEMPIAPQLIPQASVKLKVVIKLRTCLPKCSLCMQCVWLPSMKMPVTVALYEKALWEVQGFTCSPALNTGTVIIKSYKFCIQVGGYSSQTCNLYHVHVSRQCDL